MNITTNAESSSIVVQWDIVDDFLITAYIVTWTSERDHILHHVALTEYSSYTITGLTLDTVYTITVTASNRCGQGPEYKTSASLTVDFTSTISSISPTSVTIINPVTSTTTPSSIIFTTAFTIASSSTSTTSTTFLIMDPSSTNTDSLTNTVVSVTTSLHTTVTATTVNKDSSIITTMTAITCTYISLQIT